MFGAELKLMLISCKSWGLRQVPDCPGLSGISQGLVSWSQKCGEWRRMGSWRDSTRRLKDQEHHLRHCLLTFPFILNKDMDYNEANGPGIWKANLACRAIS